MEGKEEIEELSSWRRTCVEPIKLLRLEQTQTKSTRESRLNNEEESRIEIRIPQDCDENAFA